MSADDVDGVVRVLIVSGTVGVGKTTVTAAINDVLAERAIPNAALDLDALVWQWPPDSPWNEQLMFENLAAVWPNFAARGVAHLVLARVVEDPTELEAYGRAVPGAVITVCRLVADEATRTARLTARMPPGAALDWHLERTVELEGVLRAQALEDVTVGNGDRDARDVVLDVLRRVGWIDA